MGLGTGLMRTILIFFNTLFVCGGIAGLGGGIWMAVNPGKLFKFLSVIVANSDESVRTAAYTLIGASCFIILIAALGCFGACARNRCSLGIYAAFLVLILAVEIAAIVLVIVFDQKFSDDAKKKAVTILQKKYNKTGEAEFKEAVEFVQKEFDCCGVTGVKDYTDVGLAHKCKSKYYKDGCYSSIKKWVKKNMGIVIGITVAIIVFQVILFIFAICLCRSDKFEKVV